MAGYKLLKRLEIIIDLIHRRPYISKTEMIEKLLEYHEIDTTTRTLERDFKALKDEFGIEICYDGHRKGYQINTENHDRIQALLKFIELVHVGELFREGLDDFELLKDKIDIEDSSKFRGIHHVKDILLAIKNNKDIQFVHENYFAKTEKDYTITPLKLKEYLNRWYVIGVPKEFDEIRTFGLDRIEDLKVGTTSSLDKRKFNTQLDKFFDVVGLTYGEAKDAKKVVLRVDAQQIKYMASLPLHHSQKIEIEPRDTHLTVTYYLIPNYEFKIQLLKLGKMVEVLEPEELREEMIISLEETLMQYM